LSRSRLSLFEVDEGKLAAFSDELRRALRVDDRQAIVRLLSLEGPAADRIAGVAAAVDVFLASESHAPSASVFAALRRATVDRALSHVWTSDSLALEGRLRGFEPLREDEDLAHRVDTLLDGHGVPWFVRRPGDTCGCIAKIDREEVAEGLERLDDPPVELIAFARALGDVRGSALCHDTLL
jgi:hypothetical protein